MNSELNTELEVNDTELEEFNEREALFNALAAAGIHTVVVEFNGEGDEGFIDSISAFADKDQKEEVSTSSLAIEDGTPLEEAIDTICEEYLEQTHDGWENNEGAYGTFKFDVAKKTINLGFTERFIGSEYYEHEF